LQLAETLRGALSSRSEIQFGPIRPGDVERSLLDGDRLAELLGGPVALRDGLVRTAAWFRNRQSENAH
jgi:nucleoside-diphosphate-sugar epimerase